MAWVLCSKEDVMALHPVSEAELRDEWSDWVETLIQEHLGTPFLGEEQVITNEYHDGDDSNFMRVSKPPIVSVQAVRVNGLALSASDYVVFPYFIQLVAETFPRGTLNVQMDYTSGASTVSANVRMTAAAMIVAIVNYRKRSGADSSLKWSAADQKMGEEDPNTKVGLTSHLAAIMRRMLKRRRLKVR